VEISFLNAGHRDWDSVIMDPDMKKEIHLKHHRFLEEFVPSWENTVYHPGEALSWPVSRAPENNHLQKH